MEIGFHLLLRVRISIRIGCAAGRMARRSFRLSARRLRKNLTPPAEAYGSAVPDFDFTCAASTASMNPSTFTSSRKLVFVTGLPDCDFV
jgi:hypothetical protein